MTQPEPIPLPLELLLERLKGAGISLDPARQLRLLRVLERESGSLMGDPDAFSKLKFLLAPLIARTGKEQEQVYGIFEKLEQEWKEKAEKWLKAWEEHLVDNPLPPPVSAKKAKKPGINWLPWIIAIVLLGAVAWLIWEFSRPLPPKVSIPIRAEDVYRENKALGLTAVAQKNKRQIDRGHWEVRHAQTDSIEYRDSSQTLSWRAAKHGENKNILFIGTNRAGSDTARVTVHIHCADPPPLDATLPKSPIVQGQKQVFETRLPKGANAEWIFSDKGDTLRAARVERTFEATGLVSVKLNVWRDSCKNDCFDSLLVRLMVGSDRPYFSWFPLEQDEPKIVLGLRSWNFLLALFPFLAAFLYLWFWNKEQNTPAPVKSIKDIEEENPIFESAPYFIPYLPQEGKITVPRDFFRIAEVLRRREDGGRRNFDAPATVQATVSAGGFPNWRESALSRPTEYLFLVTRPGERNQQGRLFERIAAFLKRRDVPLEAFFHDGRFERFWNKDNAEGLPLAELYRLYPQHRLVLLGDAHGLVDNHATAMPCLRTPLLADLLHWKRRLLLTPEPVAGWQFQEALLHRHFLLFPADTDGILEGFDLLDRTEEHDPGSFDRWQAQLLQLHPEPSHRYRKWETVQDHFHYLAATEASQRSAGQPGQRSTKDWLCALAVSPQPDWALTIGLGRAIGVEVTHDRLLALTRIPWLSANQPDTGLRIQLLSYLSPEDEVKAREAFLEELEAVREQTKDGFAETERRANLAVQRFALDPFEPAHRALIGDLKQLGLLSGSQLAELQFIFEAKIKPHVPENDLDVWIKKPPQKPAFTANLFMAIYWAVFAEVLLFLCIGLNEKNWAKPVATPQKSSVVWFESPLDDEALRLNNQAVALWAQIDSINHLDLATTPIDDSKKTPIYSKLWASEADSLLKKAIQLRQNNYPLAEANLNASRFNRAAMQFNWYLDGMQGAETLTGIREEFFDAPIAKDSTALKADPIALAATHGSGLCSYFLQDNTNAIQTYQNLLQRTDSLYFDTLYQQMPVNLQTLLEKDGLLQPPARWLRVLVLDARSGSPVPDAQIQLGSRSPWRADRQGKLQLQFDPGARNVRAEASVSAPKYRDWTGILLIRTNITQTDIIHLIPADVSAIDALATGPPTKDLLTEAFRDFQFDDSLEVHLSEAVRMLQWIGAKDIKTYSFNLDLYPFASGILPSGYYMAIWRGKSGYRDRYGLQYGEPAPDFLSLSNEMYMEVLRPVRLNNIPIPVMLPVPGGSFTMGSRESDEEAESDEKPTQLVSLSSFEMGKYEVTIEQYLAFCDETRTHYPEWLEPGGDFNIETGSNDYYKTKGMSRENKNHPITGVSRNDAVAYCEWLSRKTGQKFRLPTEAEWEYAARGGKEGSKDGFKYAGSNNIDAVAWYSENSGSTTHPVGQKAKNQIGLYDMSGNVWEWCADWYDSYSKLEARNPKGPEKGSFRVLRGGSWGLDPQGCRAAYRGNGAPGGRSSSVGFRLARTP